MVDVIGIASLTLVGTYLIHAELYFRKLHQSFPDLYHELGSPSLFGKKTSALPLLRFFMSGKYKKLQDRSLALMGHRLMIHFTVTLLSFTSTFVYFVLHEN